MPKYKTYLACGWHVKMLLPQTPVSSQFSVRSIPWSEQKSYSDSVCAFFTKYHGNNYLGHQMVYWCGAIKKLVTDAQKMCRGVSSEDYSNKCKHLLSCGPCGGSTKTFRILSKEPDTVKAKVFYRDLDATIKGKEVPAAFNHMTSTGRTCASLQADLDQEIATLLTTAVLMFLFLIPVTFVQGLTHLEQLQQAFPFLKSILEKKFVNQVVTGYLPSVILLLFLLAVPPIIMAFSSVEGSVSRSGRKKSACLKVLYFVIWNVFFVNVLSGSVISQVSVFSSPKSIPTQLAKAVPTQASFFMTYIFTSGWAGLSIEVIQPLSLIYNLINRHIFRGKMNRATAPTLSLITQKFPENQILNVYITKYEGLGVFGLKLSTVGAGFMIPLIILTLLFNEYCRKRFSPIFKNTAAQVLIDLDQEDERCGRLQEIHKQLPSAYCQLTVNSKSSVNLGITPLLAEIATMAQAWA
ncbi:hypothetical protein MLD38_002021 [Melastoma candidum]|uniref:Uncharacterized protein n=1 Tax=Melastoma candidum TaxID=119954 RepID=A0ACB9SGP4_9MYRT|nr:hypothetical protein MLD38_002021 [Melastoma candidum]